MTKVHSIRPSFIIGVYSRWEELYNESYHRSQGEAITIPFDRSFPLLPKWTSVCRVSSSGFLEEELWVPFFRLLACRRLLWSLTFRTSSPVLRAGVCSRFRGLLRRGHRLSLQWGRSCRSSWPPLLSRGIRGSHGGVSTLFCLALMLRGPSYLLHQLGMESITVSLSVACAKSGACSGA